MYKMFLLTITFCFGGFSIAQNKADSFVYSKKICDDEQYVFNNDSVCFFIFKTKCHAILDTEIYFPYFFETQIPKGLKTGLFLGFDEFNFFYGKGQIVFIDIPFITKVISNDTSYVPTKALIEYYIDEKFYRYSNKKLSLLDMAYKGIRYRRIRKNFIIKRGPATILLFNIKRRNFNHYLVSLNTFKLLPK